MVEYVPPNDDQTDAVRPSEDWPRRDALRLALGACAVTALAGAGCTDESSEDVTQGRPAGAAAANTARTTGGGRGEAVAPPHRTPARSTAAGPSPEAPTTTGSAAGTASAATPPPASGPASTPASPPASHSAARPSTSAPRHPGPASGGASPDGTPMKSPLGPQYERAPGVTDAVALTFHGDGPPATAEALLKEVERAGARVTVLAVGRWLGEHPQMAKRILDGGHSLGNHTENHRNISSMSVAAAFAEIDACARRLQKLTGSRGRWFRPSDERLAQPRVRAAAAQAGYHTILSYDLDPLDYTDPGAAAVRHAVLGAIKGGDVVSMHLGHPGTVAALPQILDALHARGLRAVTADDLFPQEIFPPPR